ncbi:WhiB family transcriptional regulator [Streptomyces sp. CB02009]|uniref:WhiB family transcriptional regulator n=2 Tax=unclassified Streptomyces TaxID=2593676 RepID=UPI00093B9272|nr:WhiB family transcriptional regulator [Streptomyces sp. CB02009]
MRSPLVTGTADTWKEQGACTARGVDPEIFFAPAVARKNWDLEAKRLCDTCPVKARCLLDALETSEKFGVWGGLNGKERLRHRTQSAEPGRL